VVQPCTCNLLTRIQVEETIEGERVRECIAQLAKCVGGLVFCNPPRMRPEVVSGSNHDLGRLKG